MKFFEVRPEVAGGLGANTLIDRSTHPPKVSKLHYVFDGWSGDALLTSFPCFIVTSEARIRLEEIHATGITFAPLEVSVSETYKELFPDTSLPSFAWLQVTGVAGVDDFGIAPNLRLVMSERSLDVLLGLKLTEADVTSMREA